MKTVIDLSDNVKEYATSVKLLKIKKLLLCATFIIFFIIIKVSIGHLYVFCFILGECLMRIKFHFLL